MIALPFILLIGWVDFNTEPQVALSLLYLVPIVAVAWWDPGRDAVFCGVLAATVAAFGDAPWQSQLGLSVLLWNAFSRFVIFTAAALLVSNLRGKQRDLAAINDSQKRAYGREAIAARTDALTALPNFRAFVEALQRDSARAVREGSHLCVLYIDLDDFKSVNDRYGHTTGDQVLQDIAQALQSSVRGGDVVARVGGDEFIILLWHASPSDAEVVAQRIEARVEEISSAYPLANLGASVGSRFFERPPDNAEDVVRLADDAMYEVKTLRKADRTKRYNMEH